MEKEIVIKPSFVFKDYFKASIFILTNKPLFYIISIFYSFLLLNIIFSLLFGPEDIVSMLFPSSIGLLIFPAIFIFSIYTKTKTEISNNYKLKEDITYTLNKGFLVQKGESFEIKYKWNDILKIKETKKWFLVFVSKNSALVIQKSDLKDNQYKELKSLFNSLEIKKSLK